MKTLQRWWEKLFRNDRRRSDRLKSPRLTAYYWTGANPEPRAVRDISPTGLYVVTEERWYPGTVVKMSLQTTDEIERTFEDHIAVECKAMRWGEDGVGMAFVLMDESENEPAGEVGGTLIVKDRKTMERFLQPFIQDSGIQKPERH